VFDNPAVRLVNVPIEVTQDYLLRIVNEEEPLFSLIGFDDVKAMDASCDPGGVTKEAIKGERCFLSRSVEESCHGSGCIRMLGAVVGDVDSARAIHGDAVVVLDVILMGLGNGDSVGQELELVVAFSDDPGGTPSG
jgi:hypothetical protein